MVFPQRRAGDRLDSGCVCHTGGNDRAGSTMPAGSLKRDMFCQHTGSAVLFA